MIIMMELSFYGFLSEAVYITAKNLFFYKNPRFHAVTNVFHKFVVLDNF